MRFLLFICVWCWLQTTYAQTLFPRGSHASSVANLQRWMLDYTKKPHPMNSIQQKKIAAGLHNFLTHWGLRVDIQKFKSQAPLLNHPSCCRAVQGYNVIAIKKGKFHDSKRRCVIGITTHFDTKYFKKFKYVGANDGGSSTVLVMKTAQNLAKEKTNCDILFVFFDGEEPFLTEWNAGLQRYHRIDHTYGSRNFIGSGLDKLGVKHTQIRAFYVLDMVGHQDPVLSMTRGSDEKYGRLLLKNAQKIPMQWSQAQVEDDHTVFLEHHIPVVHVMDLSNVHEWHNQLDLPNIIDFIHLNKLSVAMTKTIVEADRRVD